jgi:Ca-activated chloride channel family protein
VAAAVDDLELGESTAIGEAIFASLDAVELAQREEPDPDGGDEDAPPPSQIVVMSDGETTVGRPDAEAADAANEAGIPVSTIAFGTEDAVIELPGAGPTDVGVNTESLQAIADATGGDFFAATTGQELVDAFDDIGGTVDSETVEKEIGTWFLGLGIAVLVLTSLLSLAWFSRLP